MNKHSYGDIKIFACNANKSLAAEIAGILNVKMGDSEVTRFSDGEINMRINETVRGMDVYIIQSTSPPVNENLMEILIMIDALRRSSAGRITAVIPYFGYARQDRKARSHDPISAKLVADLLTTAGADRVLSMDLHCPQLQGFFNIPVDHLRGVYLFAPYFQERFKKDLKDFVVVSPDLGSVSRARQFAEMIDTPLAIVDKRRPKANVSEVMNIIGEVQGKHAIMLDDILDTGGSLTNAANALRDAGAKSVYACCTHALFSKDAVQKVQDSALEELVVLNTIPVPLEKQGPKIKMLSVGQYFANAIDCIHEGRSISQLFNVSRA